MASFEPISSTRLYRQISRQIAERIRAGAFEKGARLPSERELASQLNVSRTTLREALIALEIEGLVEIRVGSGVYVLADPPTAPASASIMPPQPPPAASGYTSAVLEALQQSEPATSGLTPSEIIHVQLLLEPESAAQAAHNASDEELQAIQAAAQGALESDSPSAHNIVFHMAIARATGNAALVATIHRVWQLRSHSELYSQLENHFVARKIWQHAEEEHHDIAHAISQRDAPTARMAMYNHFVAIHNRLRKDFHSHLFAT